MIAWLRHGLVLGASLLAPRIGLADPLLDGKRPSLFDLASRETELARQYAYEMQQARPTAQLEVYFEIVNTILAQYPNHRYIVFGRDMEYLHDCLEAAFLTRADAQNMRGKSILVNMSRDIARGSSLSQIRNYLAALGVSAQQVIDGQQKFLMIDSAGNGTVFRKSLEAIIDAIPQNDPSYHEKVLRVLEGMPGRFLGSKTKDDKQAVSDWVRQSRPNAANIIQRIENMGFGEILSQETMRRLGIPIGYWETQNWIVSAIERRPHWDDKAISLSADGKQIVQTRPNTNRDRRGSLGQSLVILQNFRSTYGSRLAPLAQQLSIPLCNVLASGYSQN
jgi:hypothetical protein